MQREQWHLTEGLIFTHFAVFILGSMIEGGLQALALIPGLVTARPWTLVTYQFVHGSSMFWFFISMLVLWIMARPLEESWGSPRFLAFWLVATFGASLTAVALGRVLFGDIGFGTCLLFTFATLYPARRRFSSTPAFHTGCWQGSPTSPARRPVISSSSPSAVCQPAASSCSSSRSARPTSRCAPRMSRLRTATVAGIRQCVRLMSERERAGPSRSRTRPSSPSSTPPRIPRSRSARLRSSVSSTTMSVGDAPGSQSAPPAASACRRRTVRTKIAAPSPVTASQ